MTYPTNHPVSPAAAAAPQPTFAAPPPPPAQPAPVYTQELPPRPTEVLAVRDPQERKALFKLDDLENEKTAEPFVFEYQGDIFELLDPKDLDWQDLMVAQEQPRLMIHVIMPEEQRAKFLEKKLSLRKLEALLGRWQQHFGLPTAGEADGSARS